MYRVRITEYEAGRRYLSGDHITAEGKSSIQYLVTFLLETPDCASSLLLFIRVLCLLTLKTQVSSSLQRELEFMQCGNISKNSPVADFKIRYGYLI